MAVQPILEEPKQCPIRMGTPEEFRCLRETLQRVGFVQDNMEGHFHLRHISEAQFEVHAKGGEAPSAFGMLAALFLQGKSVETEDVRQAVGDRTFALLNSLGLIKQYGSSGRCTATTAIYATHGLYIVSDRWCGIDGQPFQPPVDVVPSDTGHDVRVLDDDPSFALRALSGTVLRNRNRGFPRSAKRCQACLCF